MKAIALLRWLSGSWISLCLTLSPAIAQITADGTTGTIVTGNPSFTITGGSRAGGNLFHSFSQFSVPTGGAAIFNNALDVQNILSRITGGSLSNIDGLIQANGTANLFLLNPAGILFGPNARLQIGGSFLGSTASSIRFADGTEFSAATPAPLLTVSAPVGLNFAANPAAITVQGAGYGAPNFYPKFAPFQQTSPSPGLQVGFGQTLALIGGDVNLEGGKLVAVSGQIQLGSVAGGRVTLNPATQGWTVDYNNAAGFRDVTLSKQAIADTSGLGGGAIQIQGRNVTLKDNSVLLQQNFGAQPSAEVQVTATAKLHLLGTPFVASGIWTEALGSGQGGTIRLSAGEFLMQSSSAIAQTFGTGMGGSTLTAIAGTAQLLDYSTIGNQTLGVGNSGNILFSADHLIATAGSGTTSITLGLGNSGNITIHTRRIEMSGVNSFQSPSAISAATLRFGNAGNVTVNTAELILRDGAVVDSSTIAAGNAGNVTLNASSFIEVRGKPATTSIPSSLSSVAGIVDEATRLALGAPALPSGSAGNLTITTPRLVVADGAQVSVKNQGSGQAGNLVIRANVIQVDSGGNITAVTNSGEGGNIDLQVRDVLLLRRGGFISTTAGGSGNGGNITINAPFIVAVSRENSDIIANAFQGRGGNIQITTQGIFGLKFRPFLTPESDITASSQFGVSGSVTITTPNVNPSATVLELPTELVDSSQQIVSSCETYAGSRFVITGRGGIPENPTNYLNGTNYWTDVRDVAAFLNQRSQTSPPRTSQPQTIPSPASLVEATDWRRTASGAVELYAIESAGGDVVGTSPLCFRRGGVRQP